MFETFREPFGAAVNQIRKENHTVTAAILCLLNMVKPCREWSKKLGNEAEAPALNSSRVRDHRSDLDGHDGVPAPIQKRRAQTVVRQSCRESSPCGKS